MSLNGKCYIVTGGLGGIGSGISELLKDRGAKVIITTSQKDKVNNKDIFYWSMRSNESTIALTQSLKEQSIEVTGFIHCAHIFSKPGLMLQVKADELMSSINNNFTQVFNLSKFLLKKMSRKNHGVILFLGSLISEKPHKGKTSYIIEKNMLTGLIKSIHGDFYSKGIRASILHPGLVDTKQIREKMSSGVLSEVGLDNLLSVKEVSDFALKIIESSEKASIENIDSHEISYELAGNQKWW